MAIIQPKKPTAPNREITLGRAHSYINADAVASARMYPGFTIPLANEELVEKGYAQKILEQAREVDSNFRIYFSKQKLTKSATGNTEYIKGITYLVNGEPAEALDHEIVEILPPKPRAKKAETKTEDEFEDEFEIEEDGLFS